jgi:hypothetical protein
VSGVTLYDAWLAGLVGQRFKGWTGHTYVCTAADKRDVTLVNVDDPKDVRLVSDRAIGRTFHYLD